MDELLSEKEQIDRMRAWWSDYGSFVVGGIVLGALILVGLNYYQSERLNAQIDASALYDELAAEVDSGDLDGAEVISKELASNYANTPYAAQSKLAMARLYMEQSRDQDAADELRELFALSGNEELKHVGRVRLAKVLLYQDKADDVIALLEGQSDAAFAARYAEALGDAYLALNRYDDARESYRRALSETSGIQTVDQAFVQLKLMDVPTQFETAEATPDTAEPDTAEPDVAESAPGAEPDTAEPDVAESAPGTEPLAGDEE